MLTKDKKKEILAELEEKAKTSKSLVFADYTGLSVKDLQALRNEMNKHEVEFKVARKTLVDLALKQAGLQGVDTRALEGQLGIAFGFKDEVTPAKILNQAAKDNENLKILGGVLEKEFIDVNKVLFLARLPSREELLAKLVGTIAAPMSGLVNVFSGSLRNLVYALNAVKENKS